MVEDNRLKYIIFDFDGTLVDSKEVLIKVYNDIANHYNAKTIENAEELLKLSLFERFIALDISPLKIPFLVSDMTKQYKYALSDIAMFTGVRELLQELDRRGYQLAIISSNSKANIRNYLRQNRLDIIGTIMSSNNILGKDIVIKKFLSAQKLNPQEVIYVGDEQRDIKACKKVGIKIICVDWGYDPTEVLIKEQPNYVVRTPEEILSILSGN